MGRGRRGFFDDLIKLPWPVALAVGIAGFAGIRYGVPAFFALQDGPFAQGLASASTALAPLAWIFLAACSTGAPASRAWPRSAGASSNSWSARPIAGRVTTWPKPAWAGPMAAWI